eukprot:SAG11_NODE_2701_length_3076_cov_5.049043_6_plen_54_part_01
MDRFDRPCEEVIGVERLSILYAVRMGWVGGCVCVCVGGGGGGRARAWAAPATDG